MADMENKESKATGKVDEETARLEVERFLDLKRVPDRKRKVTFEQQIKDLIGLMVDGRLAFDFESKRASIKLLVPLETKNSGRIEGLSMRFYIGMQEAQNVLKNVEASNADARSLTLAAVLSGHSPDILRNSVNEVGEKGLDISDHNSLFAYTLFFLA
jgi:hypothetical protein